MIRVRVGVRVGEHACGLRLFVDHGIYDGGRERDPNNACQNYKRQICVDLVQEPTYRQPKYHTGIRILLLSRISRLRIR